MDKNDLGSARVELERVIRVAPENLLAQRLLGDVAKGLGDTVSALHAVQNGAAPSTQ
jgi:Tfp pilus assembly protein PilF